MSLLFEQAMLSRLQSITALNSIVGSAIFKTAIPETHDLQRDGPALTYSLPTKTDEHILTGSDGTATATVQLDAWGLGANASINVKNIIEVIRLAIDGATISQWGGNNGVLIQRVIQSTDTDLDEKPEAGSDMWLRHTVSEYSIRYYVPIPSNPS